MPRPGFELRPYQIEDLGKLINNPRLGQFQEPGVGKTFICTLMTEYIWKTTRERIVWTQPGGIIMKNYHDFMLSTDFEADEVAVVQGSPAERRAIYANPRVKVLLMTGQTFAKEWALTGAKHFFGDEIHLYYTTHGAKGTQEWYRAMHTMGAIVPMTGTLIRGRLDTAYPILHVIAPIFYGNERYFMQNHAFMDEDGKVAGWKNHERLNAVLHQIGSWRTFKSVYGKENKVIQVEACEPSPKQYKMYKELEASALIELEDSFVDANQPGVKAIRARQVLACPEMFELDEQTGKDKALLVDIEDSLNSGEPIVIFAAFQKEQERIVKMIEKLGGKVGLINGTVPHARRQEIDKKFREGQLQYVVASAETAGIGFNWSHVNLMIFVSVNYTDDSIVQAMRRGLRGVREQPMLVKFLKYFETIEDRIFQIVDRKSMDFHLIAGDNDVLTLSKFR